MSQSQQHGFAWENEIREKVFHLKYAYNDTNKHDIHYNGENISVKCAKSSKNNSVTVYCADVLRFHDLDLHTKIFLITYKQCGVKKRVYECIEIDYTKKLHDYFFNGISKDILEDYVRNVKQIPRNIKGADAKAIFNYLVEKDKLVEKYNIKNIIINPKVDGTQSRVQCSFKLKNIPNEFIENRNKNCKFRGIKIMSEFQSLVRQRGGLTVNKLNQIYKQNKLHIKYWSKQLKSQKIEFLKKHNLL
tara:strand:- start:143 stop:880 length:738 start_codon:yes stop_codon:yes gene_type:complete